MTYTAVIGAVALIINYVGGANSTITKEITKVPHCNKSQNFFLFWLFRYRGCDSRKLAIFFARELVVVDRYNCAISFGHLWIWADNDKWSLAWSQFTINRERGP
jgi:hypothetical protein